jgi:cytochrome c55X
MNRQQPSLRTALAFAVLVIVSATARAADPVRMQVDAGKDIYVTTCTSCHGSEGKGALGPPLAGRNLSLDLIATTMLNGRSGTAMPPFKDVLDEKSRLEIIAYVQWLTTNGLQPVAIVRNEAIGLVGAAAANAPSDKPVAIGKAQGVPARGAALFFDPTNMQSCRTCHSYGDKGGPVGPDLSTLAKSPLQVFESITRPKVPAAGFVGISVQLRDGTELVGVKGEDAVDTLTVFDLSTVPPIRRNILKTDIASMSQVKDSGVYDHTQLKFPKQAWLDFSAYLGKSESAGKN